MLTDARGHVSRALGQTATDSKLMRHMATTHQGTLLVGGKHTYVFALVDGRRVKSHDFQPHSDWPWRHSPQASGVRYARLRATSPIYGAAIITIVAEPGADQYYLMSLDTDISSPRLLLGVDAAQLDRALLSDLAYEEI